MKNQIFDHCPQWVPEKVCLACDVCCRFTDVDSFWRPKVAKGEPIEEYFTKEGSAVKELFFSPCGRLKAVKDEDTCPCVFFQRESNECKVYMQRPLECRIYPFLLLKKSKGVAVGVHLACPYVTEKYGTEEFDESVKEVQRFLHAPEMHFFITENTCLAGEYLGYEDQIQELFILE